MYMSCRADLIGPTFRAVEDPPIFCLLEARDRALYYINPDRLEVALVDVLNMTTFPSWELYE